MGVEGDGVRYGVEVGVGVAVGDGEFTWEERVVGVGVGVTDDKAVGMGDELGLAVPEGVGVGNWAPDSAPEPLVLFGRCPLFQESVAFVQLMS